MEPNGRKSPDSPPARKTTASTHQISPSLALLLSNHIRKTELSFVLKEGRWKGREDSGGNTSEYLLIPEPPEVGLERGEVSGWL